MAVVTPPRTAETDERSLDERVAELEALIEEARRRTRRRRQRNAGVVAAVAIAAGAALYAGGDGLRAGEARSAEGDAAPAALDRAGTWSAPSGPPGFSAGIVLHPSRPGALYLRAGERVFRSTDAGRSWKSGPPIALRIDALTVDPRRGSILYAGTNDGVLKSTDAGRTWRRSGLAPPPPDHRNARTEGYVSAVELDPADSRVVYAIRENHLYRSPDGGATWHWLQRAPGPRLSAPRYSALAIHPSAPTTLYAAVHLPWPGRSAIMRSTDGGRTWRTVLRRVGTIDSLAVDPARPGTIWAAGTAGVLVTRDGGTTWRVPGRPPGPYLGSVVVDARHPGTVYVSTLKRGLFRSTDDGRSWQSFGSGLTGPLAIDPRRPRTMYAGDGYGVVRTADGGARWRRADAGIVVSSLNAVAAAASNAATVYAGSGAVLARSDNAGRTWRGLRTTAVSAIAVDPRNHRHVLVGGTRGIVASRDGGARWTTAKHAGGFDLRLAEGDDVRAIAFDAQDPLVVYASTAWSLILSSDGGRTWRWVQHGLAHWPVLSLAVHPERAGTVYASGLDGVVATSTDSGMSWRFRSIPGASAAAVLSLAVAPSEPDTLYAALDTGVNSELHTGRIARSVDGGDHWRLLAVRGRDMGAVVVDPKRAETVYVATDDGGILRSTNGGASWRPFGTRLPSRSISTLTFDATGTVLYAGTNGAGLTSIRIR